MRTAWCSACMRFETVDANWRALWIDSDGDLRVGQPERGCDLDFERPNTIFACGEGTALVLTERYLHTRNFDAELALAEAAHLPNDLYTELT